jgi:hypothetical protein
MLAASIGDLLGWVPFVLVGIAMLIWNRRITKAMIASNRAVANELGITPLRRIGEKLDRQRWFIPAMRIYIVLFALLWLGVCVAGLIAS